MKRLLEPASAPASPNTLASSSSSSFSQEVEPDFNQREEQRKLNLLKKLCIIIIYPALILCLFYLIATLLSGQTFLLLNMFGNFGAFVLILTAYWLARRGRYYIGSWLFIITTLSSIYFQHWLLGTQTLVTLAFICPLALAIVLLNGRAVLIVTGASIGYALGFYILEHALKIYTPPFPITSEMALSVNIILIIIVLGGSAALLFIPTKSQLQALQTQNKKLQEAMARLETQSGNGQSISQAVQSLAGQLTGTASQQASGSQQQFGIVTQINASVQELAVTAANIANLAVQISKSTDAMVVGNEQINQTTQQSVQQSQRGRTAVGATQQASQTVAGLYEQLVAKTEELDQRTGNMRTVLSVLATIAAETHLLALNAAIEAAGAGQFGERFTIVAQEVKNLADQSAGANRRVVEIVGEVEQVTEQLLAVAKTGRGLAHDMEETAGQAGQVIEELHLVAQEAQSQALTSMRQALEVEQLAGLIRISTGQQSSASQQVLEALHGLTVVAEQNTAASQFVSLSARDLEKLSTMLSSVLQR
jgi:methyl-accepting chemotaxis protein